MYTGKSCTEFNILTGIPPCSEHGETQMGRSLREFTSQMSGEAKSDIRLTR